MKIAVLIPTLNEESTIQFVTEKIDESLCKHFNHFQNYIVNCDSDSSDNTRQNFLNTKTYTEKISINTHQKGKGYNIITFFEFCIKNEIDYAATIDGDIKSINDEWIKKLIIPLINGANYVVPFYKRGKYDGNLTNQFVFPITCLFSNVFIRQPIGGEFGFDKKFINAFLKANFYGFEGFGIDICMTLCAIANDLKIDVANLGEKCHKTGVNNMKKMIRDVSEVLFINLQKLKLPYKNCVIPYNCINVYSYFDEEFVKKDKGKEMITISLEQLKLDKYKNYLNQFDLSIDKYISSDVWTTFLAKFLLLKQYTPAGFDFFTEIAIIRTVNYWNEIENKNLKESEDILFNYITLLQHYVENAKGDDFDER